MGLSFTVPTTPDFIPVSITIGEKTHQYSITNISHKKAKELRTKLRNAKDGSDEPTIVLTSLMIPQGESMPVASLLELLDDEKTMELNRHALVLIGWIKEAKADPKEVMTQFIDIMSNDEIEDDARFVRLKVLYRSLIGQDEAGNPKV